MTEIKIKCTCPRFSDGAKIFPQRTCAGCRDVDVSRLTPLQADAAISKHGDGPEQTAAPLKPGR